MGSTWGHTVQMITACVRRNNIFRTLVMHFYLIKHHSWHPHHIWSSSALHTLLVFVWFLFCRHCFAPELVHRCSLCGRPHQTEDNSRAREKVKRESLDKALLFFIMTWGGWPHYTQVDKWFCKQEHFLNYKSSLHLHAQIKLSSLTHLQF